MFTIYIFSYWKNKIPRKGWLYLSVEFLCFHSYILGIEEKIIVRWTDVVNLEKSSNVLSVTIKVTTRDNREVSINFLNFSSLLLKNRILFNDWISFKII